MSDQSVKHLLHYTKETYDGSFSTDLLEQYKLYVQSADNVSVRRVSSNRYLLTVNAALVASYGFQSASSGLTIWTVPVAVAGIIISLLMWSLIKSHRDLNAVKFKVIHELEKHLPAALYGYEWQLAQEGRGKIYRSVSQIELWIPVVFLALHVTALVPLMLCMIPGISY
ncbi:MAG: hypothetical protein OXM00_05475 [Paracoccaceae bacterium]|nr:hypothetical protein [Paracoccaceae bacterium]